jgi:hypothetical protein
LPPEVSGVGLAQSEVDVGRDSDGHGLFFPVLCAELDDAVDATPDRFHGAEISAELVDLFEFREMHTAAFESTDDRIRIVVEQGVADLMVMGDLAITLIRQSEFVI